MSAPRLAFVTGSASRLRRVGLAAKHRNTRLGGLVYPDVYSLPYFVTERFDFVRDGSPIEPGRYDLVFSELNRSEGQLEYLARLVDAGVPMAIIPGPPDLLASVLTQRKLELARRVVSGARHVLAYNDTVRRFADGLVGEARAVTIPWPFDGALTRRLGRPSAPAPGGPLHVLLHVPLRFEGISQSFPFVLKAVVQDVLADLPPEQARRFRFGTVVYTESDRHAFTDSGYSAGWPIRLEPKRGFRSFVRHLGRCAAVVNLTSGGVLGRITFLAGALGRPGLFSDNVELNRALYPDAVVDVLDPGAQRERLRSLFQALLDEQEPAPFLPLESAVREAGDFARNASRFAALLGLGAAVAGRGHGGA